MQVKRPQLHISSHRWIDIPSNWSRPLLLAHAAAVQLLTFTADAARLLQSHVTEPPACGGSLCKIDSVWRCDGRHDVQQAHLRLTIGGSFGLAEREPGECT